MSNSNSCVAPLQTGFYSFPRYRNDADQDLLKACAGSRLEGFLETGIRIPFMWSSDDPKHCRCMQHDMQMLITCFATRRPVGIQRADKETTWGMVRTVNDRTGEGDQFDIVLELADGGLLKIEGLNNYLREDF